MNVNQLTLVLKSLVVFILLCDPQHLQVQMTQNTEDSYIPSPFGSPATRDENTTLAFPYTPTPNSCDGDDQ